MKHLTLPNNIEAIPQLNEFIDIICEEQGIDFDAAMSLNLALEEAVVNVMDYAYPEGTEGYVDIDADADDESLTFVISDQGKEFDPTIKGNMDMNINPAERDLGGMGIFIMKNIMNQVTYQRLEGKNLLTMKKELNN